MLDEADQRHEEGVEISDMTDFTISASENEKMTNVSAEDTAKRFGRTERIFL